MSEESGNDIGTLVIAKVKKSKKTVNEKKSKKLLTSHSNYDISCERALMR